MLAAGGEAALQLQMFTRCFRTGRTERSILLTAAQRPIVDKVHILGRCLESSRAERRETIIGGRNLRSRKGALKTNFIQVIVVT